MKISGLKVIRVEATGRRLKIIVKEMTTFIVPKPLGFDETKTYEWTLEVKSFPKQGEEIKAKVINFTLKRSSTKRVKSNPVPPRTDHQRNY